MGRASVASVSLGLTLLGGACDNGKSNGDAGGIPDGGTLDGAPAAEAGQDAPKSGIPYQLSNVNADFLGLDISKVEDVTITGANNFVNAEGGDFALLPKEKFAFKRIDRQDGSRIGL